MTSAFISGVVDVIIRHAAVRDADTGLVVLSSLAIVGSASRFIRERVVAFLLSNMDAYSRCVDALIAEHRMILRTFSSFSSKLGVLNVGYAELLMSKAAVPLPRPRLRSWALVPSHGTPLLSVPKWSLRTIPSVRVRLHTDAIGGIRLCHELVPGLTDFHFAIPEPRSDVATAPSIHMRLPDTVKCASVALHNDHHLKLAFGGPVSITGTGVKRFAVLFRNQVTSLEFILMPNLLSLSLACDLKTLVGIQALTSLQTLAMRSITLHAGRSVRFLAELRDLRSLYIFVEYHNIAVAFAGVLPSLTRLTSLDVRTPAAALNNLIGLATRAPGSRGLSNLTRLSLLGTSFTRTDDMWPDDHREYDLPSTQLITLELGATQPLRWWTNEGAGLSCVTALLLDGTDYNRPSCHGLDSMPALRSLTLRHMYTRALAQLPPLSKLDIAYCRKLVDLTSVGELTDLVELRVRSCGVARLPSLAGLTRLDTLAIDEGQLYAYKYTDLHTFPTSVTRLYLYSDSDVSHGTVAHEEAYEAARALPRLRELALVCTDGTRLLSLPAAS
jgi:hypothetical protein